MSTLIRNLDRRKGLLEKISKKSQSNIVVKDNFEEFIKKVDDKIHRTLEKK
jgi:hypothetical protein